MVHTPLRSETGAAGAPKAPERPPRRLCEPKRLKTGEKPPFLELFPPPEVPTLSAKLQLDCAVPVGESFTTNALVTATPPPPTGPDAGAPIKYQDVVFCNDASESALGNGCMASAKEVLASFVNSEPPPGVVRRIRMISFGTHVVDHRVGKLQLAEINAETRPMLLEKIHSMSAWMGGTNIGDPVLFAIHAIKSSRIEDAANGIKSPELAHVITLTDGACHSCKYASPDVLTREVRETGAPAKGIQTHYIGFGSEIHGDYMKKATDSGNLGVFHAAPGASGKSGLATAFEVVLGFLGCDYTFTFEATQFPYGKEEKKVVALGALRGERTHLCPFDVRCNASGEFPVLALQMLQDGKPIGQRVVASLVFENGQPPQRENADVLEAMKKLEVHEKVQQVLQSASTNEEASLQLRSIAADGGLSAEMQDEVEEMAGVCYRSASGPQVFGAQVASQQAHGYSALEEEEEGNDDDHVPQWTTMLGSTGMPLPPVPSGPNYCGLSVAKMQRSLHGPPTLGADDDDEADQVEGPPRVYRSMPGAPLPEGSTTYRSPHAIPPHGDEDEEEGDENE